MLMNKKEFYTTPEVDVLVVRFEGEICTSGGFNADNWSSGSSSWWNDPNF